MENKIAIFGGHPNWQNKIKKLLTNAIIIDVDDMNKSFKFIDKCEAVFLNTSYCNHSFYKKVMKHMKSSPVKFYFMNHSSNVERALKEIEQSLQGV